MNVVAKKTGHREKARISFDDIEPKLVEIQVIPKIAKHTVQLLNISSTGLAIKILNDELEKMDTLSPQDIVYIDLEHLGLEDELPVLEIVRIKSVTDGVLVGFRFKCLTEGSARYLDSQSKKVSLMNIVHQVEDDEVLSLRKTKRQDPSLSKVEIVTSFVFELAQFYKGQKFKIRMANSKTVIPEFFQI